jgi:hypothetical protein
MAENGAAAPADASSAASEDPSATLLSKGFLVLLVIAAVVGVLVSLAAWCFVELPDGAGALYPSPEPVGYHNGPPIWWSLPILAMAGLITAFAIVRLPGDGGHIAAEGELGGGVQQPITVPGVVLAGLATIGAGLVLGPEGRPIALGVGSPWQRLSRRRRRCWSSSPRPGASPLVLGRMNLAMVPLFAGYLPILLRRRGFPGPARPHAGPRRATDVPRPRATGSNTAARDSSNDGLGPSRDKRESRLVIYEVAGMLPTSTIAPITNRRQRQPRQTADPSMASLWLPPSSR